MWKFVELTHFLSSLYYRQDDIYSIIQRAGLKPQHIHQSNNAVVFWTNIISYAELKATIPNLLRAVIADGHEENEYLNSILNDLNTQFKSPYFIGASPADVKVTSDQFELITNGKKTFLPISFLNEGIEKSKSVARILTNGSLGTGFVIDRGYLLTNNHVIDSIDIALKTRVQFNYELGSNGAPREPKEFGLDPTADAGFFTSKEHDWTAVKIRAYGNEFGEIKLEPITIVNNDFVNIIQHPGGEHKQIALYHNLVISFSTDRVRYLTDTLPGSSGSPVFDSNWKVVALHHKGSIMKSNGRDLLCNQGIHINLIINELKGFNVLS